MNNFSSFSPLLEPMQRLFFFLQPWIQEDFLFFSKLRAPLLLISYFIKCPMLLILFISSSSQQLHKESYFPLSLSLSSLCFKKTCNTPFSPPLFSLFLKQYFFLRGIGENSPHSIQVCVTPTCVIKVLVNTKVFFFISTGLL